MLGAIISLLLVGLAVSGPSLEIGKHYSSKQGGDRQYHVKKAQQNLHLVKWPKENRVVGNDMSRYKINGNDVWVFYDQPNYSGEVLWAKKGPVNWTGVPSGTNDKVSSVQALSGPVLWIGKHYSAKQGGDREIAVGPKQSLTPLKWGGRTVSNDMSRYKIDGPYTWAFYDNDKFSGKPLFTAKGPKGWTGVPAGTNDKVSSVKVITTCPAGQRAVNYKCQACPANYKCVGGEAAAVKCADNEKPNAAKSGCVKVSCPAGKYATGHGCANCPANNYCLGGAGAGKTACPKGTTSPAARAYCVKSVLLQCNPTCKCP